MDDFKGPFSKAQIGALEIGNNVNVIPELLFCDAVMTLEELVLQAERIGAYAFSSEHISIGHLTIGENVKIFAEYSNSIPATHIICHSPLPRILEAMHHITPRTTLHIPHKCRRPLNRHQTPEAFAHNVVLFTPQIGHRSCHLTHRADHRALRVKFLATYRAECRSNEREHIPQHITEHRHRLRWLYVYTPRAPPSP